MEKPHMHVLPEDMHVGLEPAEDLLLLVQPLWLTLQYSVCAADSIRVIMGLKSSVTRTSLPGVSVTHLQTKN